MPGPALVEVDPAQIQQVILNLIVNARQAMPRGGEVVIETAEVELDESCRCACGQAEPGPYVMLAVSDSGIGIDEANLAHVFEPFFTTKERGTGLGLATVFGIVKQSDGPITVETERNRGTTFSVYLPAVDSASSAAFQVRRTDDEGARGSETILLVEDEEGVRRLTERVLRRNGYVVLAAADGDEALRLSKEHGDPIHLLISDVVMPGGMSGFEVADQITGLRPEMKTLYVSGYSDEIVAQHSSRELEIVLLQKPYSPAVILNRVREVLDDTQRRRS
jgi:two-component system cell cycle sensor histidine kinase/response regulator CckA